MTELTSQQYYNPFFLDNRIVAHFIFFKDGKELYVSQRGWFGNNRNVDTLYIGEDIKKKIKNIHDYDVKKSYYTTTSSSYLTHTKDSVNIFLYVDGKDINIEFSEPYSVQETERNIYTYKDITIKIFDRTFVVSEVLKAEPTKEARNCEKVQKELYENGVDIDFCTLFELLKKYDVVKK